MTQGRRAVLYARVSSERQADEGYSIPAQLKLLLEYAERQSIEVVRQFTGPESASSPGREMFGEMLRFLRRANAPRILLVEKTDRATRNFLDYVALDDLRLRGLEIHLVREGSVLGPESDPSQQFAWGMWVLMARNQVQRLSAEVKKGMREKALQGGWPGRAPFGYANLRDETGRAFIAPHEDEAPVVRELFRLYARGDTSLSELAELATGRGMLGRRGRPLSKATIQVILRERAHLGLVRWRDEYLPGLHEPLVDSETFERVQALLGRGRRRSVRSRRAEELFTGLLKCGHCGCSVLTYRPTGRNGTVYTYYRCSFAKGRCPEKNLREEVIDGQVEEYLRRLHFPSDVLDSLREAVREATRVERRDAEVALGRLTAQQRKLENRLRVAYEDRVDGRISPTEYDKRAGEWKAQLTDLEEEAAALKRADRGSLEDGITLLELVRRAPELYSAASRERKRRIFQTVLLKPEIKDGRLLAEFAQPFSFVAVAAASENESRKLSDDASSMVGRTGLEPVTSTV